MKRGQGKLVTKMKQMIFLVFIITTLVACSPGRECFIVDSVKLVKTIEIKGSDYFIYLRISGSHDKAEFYELYKGKPTFGECKRPDILVISEEGVDRSAEPVDSSDEPVDRLDGVVSRIVSKLVIDDDLKLSIVYVKGNVQEIDLKDIPVEIKSLTKRSNRTP